MNKLKSLFQVLTLFPFAGIVILGIKLKSLFRRLLCRHGIATNITYRQEGNKTTTSIKCFCPFCKKSFPFGRDIWGAERDMRIISSQQDTIARLSRMIEVTK